MCGLFVLLQSIFRQHYWTWNRRNAFFVNHVYDFLLVIGQTLVNCTELAFCWTLQEAKFEKHFRNTSPLSVGFACIKLLCLARYSIGNGRGNFNAGLKTLGMIYLRYLLELRSTLSACCRNSQERKRKANWHSRKFPTGALVTWKPIILQGRPYLWPLLKG